MLTIFFLTFQRVSVKVYGDTKIAKIVYSGATFILEDENLHTIYRQSATRRGKVFGSKMMDGTRT